MKYCKILFVIFIFLLLPSCSSSEDDQELASPEIIITAFDTSKQEVEIGWQLIKGDEIVIEDLKVYRETYTDDSDRTYFEQIANLPSSTISFVDSDVPYLQSIRYMVKANYRLSTGDPYQTAEIESEILVFSRSFTVFESVPFQVARDPANKNVYHILDRGDMAQLLRYDAKLNRIVHKRALTQNFEYYSKFIFSEDNIVAVDLNGNIYFVDKDSYELVNQYLAVLNDDVEGFGIIGDRLYFVDGISFDYVNLLTGQTVKHGLGQGFKYFEVLDNKTLLSLGSSPYQSWASIYEFQDDLDPGIGWDFSLFRTYNQDLDGRVIDEFIVSWNNDRTQFVTGIEGRFFAINDLSPGAILRSITGKNYLNFIFHENGDVYAAVQNEKVIHVFDGDSFELKNEIATKLYPIFPLLTDSGLACIGAYQRVEYWGYDYGYATGFGARTAIEFF